MQISNLKSAARDQHICHDSVRTGGWADSDKMDGINGNNVSLPLNISAQWCPGLETTGRAKVYGANFEILVVRRMLRQQRHLHGCFVSEPYVESVLAFWNSLEP